MNNTYGDRLRLALERAGKTQSELARVLDVRPQAIQYLCSPKARGSRYTAAIAKELEVSADWLASGRGEMTAEKQPPEHAGPPRDVEAAEFEDGPDILRVVRAPCVGTAQLGMDGYFNDFDTPVGHGDGYVEISSRDPNAYTLRVRGLSMYPAIKNGWLVVVEPSQDPVPGEYVLLRLRDGRKTIKTFLYLRNDIVGVESVNGGETHEFWLDELEQERGIQYVGGVYPPSRLRFD